MDGGDTSQESEGEHEGRPIERTVTRGFQALDRKLDRIQSRLEAKQTGRGTFLDQILIVGVLVTTLLLAVVYVKVDQVLAYQTVLQDTANRSYGHSDIRDCCQVKKLVPSATTGIYDVGNPCHKWDTFGSRLHALCDMDTEGGNWIVIQRRMNGSVDFYRNWVDYVYGFGNLEGEFWYGLENIHCLTTRDDVELRIELGNEVTPSVVWTYNVFQVGGAETKYRLTVRGGHGVGSPFDALSYHNGQAFSTRDNDNDGVSRNCARIYGGAWWYAACLRSDLNGNYVAHAPEDGGDYSAGANRLCWYDGSRWVHYSKVQMKVRPKRCS